jgi:hypothetical protein
MAKIRFDDADDLIDICLDNVFKAVFTRDTPESQGALSKLLSALIGRELSVIGVVANEPAIDNLRDRQIRFDINCRIDDGEPVNVEMSLNPDPFGEGAGEAGKGDDGGGTLGGIFPVFDGQGKAGKDKRDTGRGGGNQQPRPEGRGMLFSRGGCTQGFNTF